MLRLISLVLLVTSCATTSTPVTAAEHEERARHYDATADSIENECWKARRDELTVDPHTPVCWKAEDIRFLEANRRLELSVGRFACVVFERHARVNCPRVEMVELVQLGGDVIFDGFGESDVVRGQDQFHIVKVAVGFRFFQLLCFLQTVR